MREYGYLTQSGYRGLVRNRWMLFASHEEYLEYLNDQIKGEERSA